MSVHAGDVAIYKPRKGKPVRVLVHGITAKRARVIVPLVTSWGAAAGEPASPTVSYTVRYVKRERLEKVLGGAC